MVVLVISTFMQVVFRFILNSPLAWTEELARYCLVFLTFLGAAYAMAMKQHVLVEFFTNLFPPIGRKIFYTVATLVNLFFFGLMIYYGLQLSMNSMEQLSPVLRIPMGAIYAVIPVSGFLLVVNTLSTYIQDIKKGDNPNDNPTV